MPYTDYDDFGERYFEADRFADGGNPAGYSDYRREMLPFDHYAAFIDAELAERGYDSTDLGVIVVGCAYGYTVEFLRQRGFNAWGIDVSSWAVSNDATGGYVLQGDATDETSTRNAIKQTSISGKPDVGFVECVIECLTDSEAQSLAATMEKLTSRVGYRVWSTDGSDLNTAYYNAKTLAEWQSLLDSQGVHYWWSERAFQPHL